MRYREIVVPARLFDFMRLLPSSVNRFRIPRFLILAFVFLSVSLFALAQLPVKYRPLNGYFINNDAPLSKGKTTLFLFEQADAFQEVFQTATGKKGDPVNFEKEIVAGIAIPPTRTPPRLSISRVFVQDSTLTIRYIRQADTTLAKRPLTFVAQPILVVAIPKQTVLRTRLIENGRLVQTVRTKEEN